MHGARRLHSPSAMRRALTRASALRSRRTGTLRSRRTSGFRSGSRCNCEPRSSTPSMMRTSSARTQRGVLSTRVTLTLSLPSRLRSNRTPLTPSVKSRRSAASPDYCNGWSECSSERQREDRGSKIAVLVRSSILNPRSSILNLTLSPSFLRFFVV